MNKLFVGFSVVFSFVVYISILQYFYILKKDMLERLPNKANFVDIVDDSRINKSFYIN